MAKIPDSKLIELVSMIDRLEKAVNILEALPVGKRVYQQLKAEAQQLSEEVKSRYFLKEYSDINARDKWLEQEKKENGQ